MRRIAFAFAMMATLVAGAATIAWGVVTPEVRPFVGAFIPTGAQKDFLNDGLFVGLQGGIEIAERAHVVGSAAWAPSKTSKDVCAYSYDLGVETFRPLRMGERWEFRPFLGAGLGARTYVDHGNNNHKETNLGGYGALGAEFQLDRLALRAEGRNYITRFTGLRGGAKAEARNDIALITGLAVHW